MRLINRKPGKALAVFLALLPFALALGVYVMGSQARLAVNPQDKLLPSLETIGTTAVRLLTEPDRRTDEILFWKDTVASLWRLGAGVLLASFIGLVTGLLIGLLPLVRATLAPFVAVLSMIPPLAVLPILFILLGLGETSKIALIAIGITPFLI
ncbi:MAG: ABC transporter permease, partial [Pseudomonadota bacterium]